MRDDERLAELRKKETLTHSEMQELIRLSPAGSFKSGPNLLKIGIVDIEQAAQNFKEGPNRTRLALKNGCYIEVISLRLQHIEFWLRMFWVVKNNRGMIFELKDKRTFGRIITDCKGLGFRKDLVERMERLNKDRINAIHKYLLGATNYSALKEVCDESAGLDGDVGEYVRQVTGFPIN